MTAQERQQAENATAQPLWLDFFSLSRVQLAEQLELRHGVSAYRSIQLFKWVYGKRTEDLTLMTDIKAQLRAELAEQIRFYHPKEIERIVANDGTIKFLLEYNDGAKIETVIIKQANRNTLCLSSQVGCAMGCRFCRTATIGLQRNLSCSEIVQQLLLATDYLKAQGEVIQNIVFMGMGEPLHNWNNVYQAISILTDQHGLGFAARRITVSTAGLVPGIEKMKQAPLKVNLAVSLNATTDQLRSDLMPLNHSYPIKTLLAALRGFKLRSNRRITIEYVLLEGLNDSQEDLIRLVKLLKPLPVKVNIVPFNGVKCLLTDLKPPQPEKVIAWAKELNSLGIDTTIRWSKGSEIGAACGQLAASQSTACKTDQ